VLLSSSQFVVNFYFYEILPRSVSLTGHWPVKTQGGGPPGPRLLLSSV
jgi:hypothetical protein